MMKLTLLDKYILKQLLDYFFIGLVAFTLALFFSDALLDFMLDLQRFGIPMDIALTIIGLQMPKIVGLIIPMGALLATLMVYYTLNNQFELITFRMSGVSLYRIALPAIVLGISASAVAYVLQDYITPMCEKYTRILKVHAVSQVNLPSYYKNFTYKQLDDNQQLQRLIHVSGFKGKTLGYSTVIDLTNEDFLQVIQAGSGTWGDQAIQFNDANVYTVSAKGQVSNTTHAHQLALEHIIQSNQEISEYLPRELSFIQLRHYIADRIRREGGVDVFNKDIYVVLWEKIAMPLSCLPLVLIAVPLAVSSPRKANNYGYFLAILTLFCYYVIHHISVQMGNMGVLPPPVAAFLPFVAVSITALVMLHRRNLVL